jgi:hypothetical protein
LQKPAIIQAFGCAFDARSVFLDANLLAAHPRRMIGKTPQNRRPRVRLLEQQTILPLKRF